MDPMSLIVLRAVHVIAGAFWVGAALMLVAFVAPTVRALGPDGGGLAESALYDVQGLIGRATQSLAVRLRSG